MASVPYTAEAPSLSTSTRSTAAIGIEFRSTAEPFMPWVATRRPLSSTSVESAPWPRRLADEAPLLPRCAPEVTSAFDARLSEPLPLMLRVAISCSAVTMPWSSSCLREMISTGSAPSLAMRLMLEPVISTRCICPSFWACAMPGATAPIRAINPASFFNFTCFSCSLGVSAARSRWSRSVLWVMSADCWHTLMF